MRQIIIHPVAKLQTVGRTPRGATDLAVLLVAAEAPVVESLGARVTQLPSGNMPTISE